MRRGGRRTQNGRDSRLSGDTVHKERGDAIHLQPYKKPALLPGDHDERVGCGILTLSHAILSRRLRVLTRQLRFREWTRRGDSPPAASCKPGIRKLRLECTWSPFWNLAVSIVTKMTGRRWAPLAIVIDVSL